MKHLFKAPRLANRSRIHAGLIIFAILLSMSAFALFPAHAVHADSVTNSVDWNNVQYSTSNLSYGDNAYSAVDTALVGDGSYGNGMTSIGAGILRFHRWDMIDTNPGNSASWLDAANHTWDAHRIAHVFDTVNNWVWSNWYSPEKLVNVPGWPTWMSTYTINDGSHNNATVTSSLLSPSEYDNFANFCAQLVKVLNVDQHRGIKYFEVLNEEDQNYYVNIHNYNNNNGTQISDKLDELINLYNQVARAMKAVDPSIQIVGPAFARPDLSDQVQRFIDGTAYQSNPTTLDGLSAHSYASGDANDADAKVYDAAQGWGGAAAHIRSMLNGTGRHIALWWDEFNISWSWTNNDSRMHDNKGAVFDALAVTGLLDGGVDTTTSWNDADGIYGKLDPYNNYNLRPAGQLLKMLNAYMIGQRVQTSTSAPSNTVIPFAVHGKDHFAYLLINRSSSAQTVATNFNGWPWGAPGNFTQYQISSAGYSSNSVSYDAVAGGLSLPDNSVTLLTT